MSVTVQTRSRSARTAYEVLSANDQGTASLLWCQLFTGRTHQIRVHLASIGSPLVADSAYETKQFQQKNLPITTLQLHAYQLEFYSPAHQKNVVVTSPVPVDFFDALNSLQVPLPQSLIQVGIQ